MTTNQTIDGVPRELVRENIEYLRGMGGTYNQKSALAAKFELLLLDPTPPKDLREQYEAWADENGYDITRNEHGDYAGIVEDSMWTGWQARDELRALLDAESAPCAKSQVDPAAQPQGEPGGYVLARQTAVELPGQERKELGYTLLDGVGVFHSAAEVHAAITELGLPLGWVSMSVDQLLPGYMMPCQAEQPASVAVSVQTRHTDPVAPEPHGDENSGYVQSKPKHLNRHGKLPPAGNDRITMRNVHLVGTGSPTVPITYTQNGVIVNLDGYTCYAPGAEPKVLMPERKPKDIHKTDEAMGYYFGWNACLEELNRLNKK